MDVRTVYGIRTLEPYFLKISSELWQVRGPVQLTFARSIDDCLTEHSITRMAVELKRSKKNKVEVTITG